MDLEKIFNSLRKAPLYSGINLKEYSNEFNLIKASFKYKSIYGIIACAQFY